jgi:hypothetical protein
MLAGMRNPFLRWSLLVAALAAAGCGGAADNRTSGDLPAGGGETGGISEVPNPTPAMAARNKSPLRTLERGHEVYMLRCAECHSYQLPDKFGPEAWRAAMQGSGDHAEIAADDRQAVLTYVLTVRGS